MCVFSGGSKEAAEDPERFQNGWLEWQENAKNHQRLTPLLLPVSFCFSIFFLLALCRRQTRQLANRGPGGRGGPSVELLCAGRLNVPGPQSPGPAWLQSKAQGTKAFTGGSLGAQLCTGPSPNPHYLLELPQPPCLPFYASPFFSSS